MNPERLKHAKLKFTVLDKTPTVLFRQGEFSSAKEAEQWFFYSMGFEDGVKMILNDSKSLSSLEQSLKLKDIRLDILEKENRNLKVRLEHRIRLHEEIKDSLLGAIDRLSVVLAIREPKLVEQMNKIRERLEIGSEITKNILDGYNLK